MQSSSRCEGNEDPNISLEEKVSGSSVPWCDNRRNTSWSFSIPSERIVVAASTYVNVPVHILMANRREYSKERFIVYYLCKELSGDSLTQIGRACNYRDHTTILHGQKEAQKILKSCEGSLFVMYAFIKQSLIQEAKSLKEMGWL